jgi:hypothetical protein
MAAAGGRAREAMRDRPYRRWTEPRPAAADLGVRHHAPPGRGIDWAASRFCCPNPGGLRLVPPHRGSSRWSQIACNGERLGLSAPRSSRPPKRSIQVRLLAGASRRKPCEWVEMRAGPESPPRTRWLAVAAQTPPGAHQQRLATIQLPARLDGQRARVRPLAFAREKVGQQRACFPRKALTSE